MQTFCCPPLGVVRASSRADALSLPCWETTTALLPVVVSHWELPGGGDSAQADIHRVADGIVLCGRTPVNWKTVQHHIRELSQEGETQTGGGIASRETVLITPFFT